MCIRDRSYSAFDFNLYSDPNLNNSFFTSGESDDFNVVRSGRIGIDATANLTIKNVKEINETLYYNLSPINELSNSSIKLGILDPEIETPFKLVSNLAVISALGSLDIMQALCNSIFAPISSRTFRKAVLVLFIPSFWRKF